MVADPNSELWIRTRAMIAGLDELGKRWKAIWSPYDLFIFGWRTDFLESLSVFNIFARTQTDLYLEGPYMFGVLLSLLIFN